MKPTHLLGLAMVVILIGWATDYAGPLMLIGSAAVCIALAWHLLQIRGK